MIGHAVSALGRGAGDADQGSAVAGDEQGVRLASGGGDPRDHAAWAGVGGRASWSAISEADAGCRDREDSAAVSGAVCEVPRAALLLDGTAGARSEALVQLRQADPA